MDVNSLAHTKWECKYHIVFEPKYRRQVIYKQINHGHLSDIIMLKPVGGLPKEIFLCVRPRLEYGHGCGSSVVRSLRGTV